MPRPASRRGRRHDMLGTKPEAEQAGWNAAQQRPLPEEPKSQRRRELPGTLEYAADHPVLDEELELLRRAGRELPSALDRLQVVLPGGALPETGGQDVGSGNRVLNCEIYAHPADPTHR